MRRVVPRWAGTILTGILAAALTRLPVDAAGGQAFGTSEIVSRADPAAISDTAGGESSVSSVSADGRYVALVSDATNLIPSQRDTNNTSDLFLYDRVTGEMTLVSHAAGLAATAGNNVAQQGALSADGRFLAFASFSDDLVPGSGAGNIFLYDRVTGATSLVSRSPSSSSPATSPYGAPPLISANGRYVAYLGHAPDLVPGQQNAPPAANGFVYDNVFLYDRVTNTTALVSHAAGRPTATANYGAEGVSGLSPDGRFVLFTSYGSDLIAGQSGSLTRKIFLQDRETDTTFLVSHAAAGPTTAGNQSSFVFGSPALSADGCFVLFASLASDLLSGQIDPFFTWDVFLWDRNDGSTRLVSHAADAPATAAHQESQSAFLSADSGTIVFNSLAENLVSGPWEPSGGAYLYDRVTGTNHRVASGSGVTGMSADGRKLLISGTAGLFLVDPVSGSSTPGFGDGGSFGLLSGDGSAVAFSSASFHPVGLTDTNSFTDTFLYESPSQEVTTVSRRAPDLPSRTAGGNSTIPARGPSASSDGRWVAFVSDAGNLVPGQVDPQAGSAVFLRDRETGTTLLVSHTSGSPRQIANAGSEAPVVSQDGRFVAFQSYATDLTAGQEDAPETLDAFLYDRETGTVTLLSHAAGMPAVAAGGEAPALGPEGDAVVFMSTSDHLVPGQADLNEDYDVFVYIAATGTTALASHTPDAPATTGDLGAGSPALSANGRFVAFQSSASNLVPGDSPGTGDVFLYNQKTRTVKLVPRAAGVPDTAYNSSPVISANGRFVAFENSSNVFLYDRIKNRTVLVSHAAGAPTTPGDGYSSQPVLDRNDGLVAFTSSSTNLATQPQTVEGENIFLYDSATDQTKLVSHSAAFPTLGGNGGSMRPLLSANGHWIAFVSTASDLVPGQVDNGSSLNVFLFNQVSGKVFLVDSLPGSTATATEGITPNDNGEVPLALSANGRCVVFQSYSSDLATGDFNRRPDVFATCRNGGDD